MKRLLLLCVAALLAVPILAAAPAGAAKYDNCDLLTRKQATKILGYKVVATRIERDTSNGAEQCEWRTKHYFGSRFQKIDAPYKLQVTTQPLTRDLERRLPDVMADKDTTLLPDLGDRVFSAQNQLIAVIGPVVLTIETANWSTEGDTTFEQVALDPEVAAAKLLIPLFENRASE